MADNVNNISRKRKSSDYYNNFGVDDLECSPSNSPEPGATILKCTVQETEIMQTSTGKHNLSIFKIVFLLKPILLLTQM